MRVSKTWNKILIFWPCHFPYSDEKSPKRRWLVLFLKIFLSCFPKSCHFLSIFSSILRSIIMFDNGCWPEHVTRTHNKFIFLRFRKCAFIPHMPFSCFFFIQLSCFHVNHFGGRPAFPFGTGDYPRNCVRVRSPSPTLLQEGPEFFEVLWPIFPSYFPSYFFIFSTYSFIFFFHFSLAPSIEALGLRIIPSSSPL